MTDLPTQNVEVRCCCDPVKLLGYVPLRTDLIVRGAQITWALLPVGERASAAVSAPTPQMDTLTLQLEQFWLGHTIFTNETPFGGEVVPQQFGLAFRSDDTPLETLRRIPGWQDAPQVEVSK